MTKKPIANTDQEGGPLARAAGLIFLANKVTGTEADDDDIRETLETSEGITATDDDIATIREMLKR